MGEKKKGWAASLHGLLMSMRFSLVLLGLIAAGSIFGTFIRQGGTDEEYLTVYAESTYRVIRFFNLDDVYHSGWFYGLIGLFTLNLLLCTIRQLRKILADKGRQGLPDGEKLKRLQYSVTIPDALKAEKIGEIKKSYHLVHEESKGMIFEKGRFARWGILVTHGSILVILAGALAGLTLGFRGFVVLGVGETRDRMMVEGGNHRERALGFAIRCKDFKASFYPDGTPKDYVSTVEIIENGRISGEKNIRVNDPLFHKGTRIYQSGYGQSASFGFRVNGEDVELAEQDSLRRGNLMFKIVRFARDVHSFGPGVQVVYLSGDEVKTTWFLPNVERLRSQVLQGVPVKLREIREKPYTSLEVSGDPGIPLVWTGFILILLGLYVTFFACYRRIFVVNTEDGAIAAGYAVGNKEVFRREFENLKKGPRIDGP